MSFLFLKKHLEAGHFEKLLGEYSKFLAQERYSAFPLEATLEAVPDGGNKEELTECVRLVESSSDAITDGLKGNPRQIKRFLNSYWLRKKLGSVAQLTHIKDHILIKLMVLEYVSSDRFEELYSLHRLTDDGTVDVLGELEETEAIEQLDDKFKNWRTPRVWKWLKSEPTLAGVDLRDYFWVSRSSVSDTLSGVRLLSHAMRQCVDALLSASITQQNRVDFFGTLTEDEQTGVLSMVSKKAMQDPSNQTPLESLLGLAVAGFEPAANVFKSSALKIGASQLNPGLGIILRGAKPPSGSRSEQILSELIANLAKTETRIGRALKLKKNTK